MGYEIRTLQTLGTQARQFFTQAVTGALVNVWANTFTVLGKVFALLDFEHEMRRQWLFDQLFASTAEEVWLTRHGFELGLTPDPGNFAVGSVTIPSVPDIVAPAGMSLVRADGATFTTLAAVPATGSSVILPVQADVTGAVGNTAAGETFSIVLTDAVPIALGAQAMVAAGGLTGGTDAEDLETFRARVLYRKRNPPQGGSIPDYVQWTTEALSTVDKVYVDSFTNESRAVWICPTVTDQPNGIPTSGEVATIQAYVNDPIRRPVTARVTVFSPVPVAQPVTIANFYPDTDDTRSAVAVELAALQIDDIQPATPSTPFVLYREAIDAAINRAAGVVRFTLVTPAADIMFSTAAQMPVLQAPTYV